MKRYYVIFTGMVQGVGFRWTVLSLAQRHNYSGWIRNMYNGNVEMEIQGDNLNIYSFIQDIQRSARWAKIDDYSLKERPVEQHEYGFDVRGYY